MCDMKIAMIGISETEMGSGQQKPHGNDFELWEMNEALSQVCGGNCIVPIQESVEKSKYSDIEYFLFPDFFRRPVVWMETYKAIFQLRKERNVKLIYVMQEPESVIPVHSKSKYTFILKYFDYILTYNDELVDCKRVFKLPIPYNFSVSCRDLHIAFADKKLLTNISGWHTSSGKHELYSERERVIRYFEDNHAEQFDFYGFKWDKSGHKWKNYKGLADNKYEIYQRYKFAMCLENTYGTRGYITEKIMDCFKAGIVPIYKGAPDIQKYIPDSTYISYDRFHSVEELYQFLSTMSYEAYEGYRNEIALFMNSARTRYFTIEHWAEALLAACGKMEEMRRLYGIGSLQRWYTFHMKVYPKIRSCMGRICKTFKVREHN